MDKCPNIDFETYSEAGFRFDEARNRWVSSTTGLAGLPGIGAAAYSEHESTEVLSLSYNMHDGQGVRLWLPNCTPPKDLLDHCKAGGLIRAANTRFEFLIWNNVCTRLFEWEPLTIEQLRDPLAQARAYGLPGSLQKAIDAIGADVRKLDDGKRLIKKFSCPRNPTKDDDRRRVHMNDDVADAMKFYEYNMVDVEAEDSLSDKLPELSQAELATWHTDQRINDRGMAIDLEALAALTEIIDDELTRGNAMIRSVTDGAVSAGTEVAKILRWCVTKNVMVGVPQDIEAAALTKYLKGTQVYKHEDGRGTYVGDGRGPLTIRKHPGGLKKEDVAAVLSREDLDPDVRTVLKLRQMIGAASVKKVYSIAARLSNDGRLRDLFMYCGADRTGRFAGRGPQPQNLPNSGPKVGRCSTCGELSGSALVGKVCPCGEGALIPEEWGVDAAELFIKHATTDRAEVSRQWGDPVAAVAGSLRCLFVASPGHDLICSDYSAIEAVVLAELAGEQWRMDVFNTHGKIYEMSAAKITGIPFDDMMNHKKTTGEHHPMRKKIGKVAELASGFGGGIGAWKAFGADKHLTDEQITESIAAWRRDSPMIKRFWFECEGAAIRAIRAPGSFHAYRGIMFYVENDVLRIRLLSGRCLSYHRPTVEPKMMPWGDYKDSIFFWGVDSLTKQWVNQSTWYGSVTENIVQATARDLLTHAMNNLEAAGYPIVLHVHDEAIAEVPQGFGSVEEFEKIMAATPEWAATWPVRAAGGWRGKRYRKD